MTCLGAVEGSVRVQLRRVNAVAVDAVVVAVDPWNNLALLKADGKFSSLQLGGPEIPRNGTSIFLVGFSSVDDVRQQPELEAGAVTGRPPSATDDSEFQTTIPAKPGFCGAPVVTRNGEVAGVLVTGLHVKNGDHWLPHGSSETGRVAGSSRALNLLKSVSSALERNVKRPRRPPAESSLRSQVLTMERRLLYMTRNSKDLSAASTRSELESRLSYQRAGLDRITRSKERAMRKLRELQLR